MTTVTMTAEEADALFEAAEFARKNSWHTNHLGDRLKNLNSAVRKLRRATTIHIEQEKD